MLEVICGPMYSGKSTELIRRLDRARIGGKSIVLLRPRVDSRFSDEYLITHSGSQMLAKQVGDIGELWNSISGAYVIGLDEVQFFEDFFIKQFELLSHYRQVIVAGLDTTYRAEPFGIMPHLMAIADKVDKLTAVCHVCGEDAIRTQRLIDGKPAPFEGPTVLVGGLESYEARCRRHFEVA